MPDAKRTKRLRDDTENLSLEELINRRRAELVNDREEATVLRAQADTIRSQLSCLTARWQVRLKADLQRRIDQIEEEAAVRESMTREHAFETNVVSYLRRYHQRSDKRVNVARRTDSIQAYVQHTDMAHQHKTSIIDEYLTDIQRAPSKVAMATRDECPRCDSHPHLLLCSTRSIMSCPECGYSVTYLDATSSSTSFDEMVEFSQYSYKRVNHYVMWLQLVQGKETHRVSDDIIQAVMTDLYERTGIRNVDDITQKRVRDSLRHLRLRRAYDHVAQVTARLTGKRPCRITPQVEEQLKNMFLQMQPSFQRHAPKSRTNFLSYSYVLYRCFQILGLHEMLPGITLLKGRDKLEANDAIFKKMCADLGWPVFDLPPASDTT